MVFLKKKTIFDLPIDEARGKLEKITNAVYNIVNSNKFKEISAKINLPTNATKKQVKELVGDAAPLKLKQILDLILVDSYEDIMVVLSTLFLIPLTEYKKTKSINNIIRDINGLTKQNKADFLGFFSLAKR